MVVVYRFDRISRSTRDFHILCDRLEELDIGIVSVSEQINTTEPAGKAMRSVMAAFNQLEVDTIKKRTRDKIAEAKRQGRWCGGLTPLGYRVHPDGGKLEIVPEEADVVRTIFKLYLKLESLMAVAEELNRRGWLTKRHKTKTGKIWGGKQWTKTSVHNHITNALYVGEVRHKGETYDGQHEALISRKTWDRVQKLLTANRRNSSSATRNNFRHLLRGMVHCKSCQALMSPTITKKDGRAYKYLVCSSATRKGWHSCPHPSVSAPRIEAFVVDMIKTIGSNPDLQAETLRQVRLSIKEGVPALKDERKRLQIQLRKARSEIDNLVAAIGSGQPAGPSVTDRLRELEGQVETLDRRIAEIGQKIDASEGGAVDETSLASALGEFIPIWDLLFPMEQERIIHLLVERIDFDGEGGKIEMTFRPVGIMTLAGEITQAEEAIQ
jgi:site-specific DNA recombinase